MAMIKCVECGNMISDRSEVCVHCGCPTKESLKNHNESSKYIVRITISDKSEVSVHCGDSTKESLQTSNESSKNMVCNINGTTYDFSDIYNIMINYSDENRKRFPQYVYYNILRPVMLKAKLTDDSAAELCRQTVQNQALPYVFVGTTGMYQATGPTCPKCGFTPVSTGKNSSSEKFVDSTETEHRCPLCGHQWAIKR